MGHINNRNIVIITNGNFFAHLIMKELIEKHQRSIKGVLIITGDYVGRSKLKSIYELSKVTGLPYVGFKILQYLALSCINLINPGKIFNVDAISEKYQLPVKKVRSLKDKSAFLWVSEKKPNLIVSVSCPQMIGKKYLKLAEFGGINVHSSLLPQYAGLAPYFWVLANGEKETGITVHYMTLKFDQGNILEQESIKILPEESAHHLFLRLALTGKKLLPKAIDLVYKGDPGTKQDLSNHSYFSNPSFEAYRNLRKNNFKLFKFSDIKDTVKAAIDK